MPAAEADWGAEYLDRILADEDHVVVETRGEVVTKTGKATCPYCGTVYTLKPGAKVHSH